MLTITLTKADGLTPVELKLEHSLVSLSKWEAKWEKPFYSAQPKTQEEDLDYVVQMVVEGIPPADLTAQLTDQHIMFVREYINSKQTATTFREIPGAAKGPSEIITSEVIYHWLITFKIPFQPIESWHLNRLMTLVRVCSLKQTKPKRMSKAEAAQQQHRLNAERRAKLGTSG